jgi:hypothetical protein
MSGDKLAVGANNDDGSASNAGCVYTFTHDGTDWVEDSLVLRPSGIGANDFFGTTIEMSGNKMVVGVWADDGIASDSGCIYTFTHDGTDWIEDLLVLRPSGLDSGDHFGGALAISGNNLAAGGSRFDDGVGNTNSNSGAVYTFTS